MSIEEELKILIESETLEKVVLFLKSLSTEHRELLNETVNMLFIQNYRITLLGVEKRNSVQHQLEKLLVCSFVCGNEEEFTRRCQYPSKGIKVLLETDLLSWFVPTWFEKFLNNNSWAIEDYETLMKFKETGIFTPSRELIIEMLHKGINPHKIRSITIQEHIWYLFEENSGITHPYDFKWSYMADWITILQKLIDMQKIELKRVIELSLDTITFESINTFFFDLIDVLKPNEEILISLQDKLFVVLNSNESKPINITLKQIKKIIKDKHFDTQKFIDIAPQLLAWDIKSIQNATLSIIDALMREDSSRQKECGVLICSLLSYPNLTQQKRVIKILTKYKLLDDSNIIEELSLYSDNLFGEIQELLPNMDKIEIEESFEITPPQYIREDNKIPTYESFDDLVFFFSQVFEGKNAYDFDLFVEYLPIFHISINEQNASKVEPIFQQAYKYYERSIHNLKSEILFTMAQGILYYGTIYLKHLPKLHQKIAGYYDKMAHREDEIIKEIAWYRSRLIDFTNISSSPSIFNIHRHLIANMLNRIKILDINTPIYMPTHVSSWLEAQAFINRVAIQEKNGIAIDSFEFQIAFSRMIIDIEYKTDILGTEMKMIFDYFRDSKSLKIENISNPSFWLVPLLRKNNPQDLVAFAQVFQKDKHEIYFSNIFDGTITHKNATNTTFTSHCVQLTRTLSFDSIFNYTRLQSSISGDIVDQSKVLYLFPTLPNFIFEALYKTPYVSFESFLPSVIEIWKNFGNNVYLFVARTITDKSKITRQFTAELWIKATTEGTMNHQLLGKTLGKLEHNEYAPLKRFTDLIVANMLNISSLHNRGLETLLSSMIKQMNDEPIKGTKKLLEIYLEVLSLTKQNPSEEVLKKLVVWGEVKSLKSVCSKIIQMNYDKG